MNILMLSWRDIHHPQAGGAEIVTFEHAKYWVKAGQNVTLFTSRYPGSKSYENLSGVLIHRYGDSILGVRVFFILWYFLYQNSSFDLVIDEFHGIPFFIPLFIKTKKLALIYEVTGEVWRLNPWPPIVNLLPSLIGYYLEPLIFRFVYNNIPFLTISNSTKEELILMGVKKEIIKVIYCGVSRNKYILPAKNKTKTITYLGSLTKDKGIDEAIKVFHFLNKLKSTYVYWVIGKGDSSYVKKIHKLVNSLNIDKKVKFWGFVSEKKKYELLSKSSILVHTSIKEGWGLSVIEAATVKTPTAGFNISGLRDSVKNSKTGILSNKNAYELAEKINNLLNDEQRYENMCNEASAWSKKFTWEDATKKSLKLLKKIVHE